MSATETAQYLVHQLIARDVKDAVIAPGSRSGPLALALHAADAQGLIRLHVRVDEREAGFLALGLAKSSRRPVPVVTTSGTAVANLHPAMLEALHAGVPVIAVTADRPGRLRGTGANQTTEQRKIFPGIQFTSDPWEAVRFTGPRHLNLELDEPLIEPVAWDFSARRPTESSTFTEPLVHAKLEVGPQTVVVAGDDSQQAARELAEQGGWPLFAEPTSGSRTGDNALAAYRLVLQHSPLTEQIERVISFGHSTLSRPITQLLSRTDIEIVHVGTPGTFPVPAGGNVRFVDVVEAAADDDGWLSSWLDADKVATAAIDAVLDGATPYDVARTINHGVPPDGLLFVGSSNPVRDLDLVAASYPVGEHRLILGNRGLAGIDGTLSSAIGAALGRSSSRAIAYVGDLTFLHGSNGLLMGPGEPRPDLTIVVASDDGGSIFSTLEQGSPEYADSFERVYATPTGADISALCAAYGVPHHTVGPKDLAAALAEQATGMRVLEVPVDRLGRQDLTSAIDAAVRTSLQP
ncbi:2-succinyl-5-enolpyruvyl-6-hydroxy-3-cyclohexene-1-carboxylate synthase [Aeromicrobium panaciterrae]|uniref:2-succinyl-5-enolpyruvyl-6-hydroxy-3-cyclohexene-1-carboxylate synthase n=1 Tax=Aeromicrobium panaciterrae TaxID=363861 RepID=A0ABU1URV3_9ACTN|nr:2-succinyl-5-enolpyruvyl-6-hydroxy-3-cyclohexene-1-carboxylic-acid synthase [Aeromicrobium panaciterrae]MDR7087880.1 2-succinyl-5-enolpyruvyl-6-hydroxy-3-cyclohexene-1-carboxylate synthase [Aeromicrobium panaciterrae]